MKKFKDLLLLATLLLGCSSVWGQAALGFKNGVQANPDTVVWVTGNETVEFSMTVENKGTGTLNGPIEIRAKYNLDPTVFVLETYNAVDFKPGDTVNFVIDDTVGNSPYGGGDNIIVIWPAALDNQTVPSLDTADVPVFVAGLTSTIAPMNDLAARLKAWPNPVRGNLQLEYLSNQSKLEYVRISNTLGQINYERAQAIAVINTEGWKPGVYFLEVKYEDGFRGAIRLLVTR